MNTLRQRIQRETEIEGCSLKKGTVLSTKRDPYRQIVIAEKQGVRDLLLPICERRKATLCLPGGELSDQMMYDMLAEAAEDGRPVAIHQLGDFDPAGWQMAISTSRTVQALVDSQFPDMHVRVHAIGLTRDHCEEWDLPSSPLKETEMRGTAWKAAMGREQTELDAAVALAPDEFAEVVDNSLLQYFDTKVAKEAALTMIDAEIAANKKLTESIGLDTLQRIREEAESKLDDLTEQVDQVNDALRIDPGEVGIEMPEVPEILVGDVDESDHPLLDTDEDWMEQTTQLRDRKGYI